MSITSIARITLGFDVYGTLIDTHGIIGELEKIIGDDGTRFSSLWREKQLEYSFRRGLMRQYQNFEVCTRNALDYTAAFLNHKFSHQQKQTLTKAYSTLPAFDDVIAGLTAAKNAGFNLYAFSNGRTEAVHTLLSNAGIREYFTDVVSVDAVGTFKPAPEVYHHLVKATEAQLEDVWLISSNSFDVIGALAVGMKTVSVQRSSVAVFDPWEYQPTLTVDSIEDLPHKIEQKLENLNNDS